MPLTKHFFIWFFALSIIIGPAYNTYLNYDCTQNPDCNTYLSIADRKFEDQSLVRRYRILVPFAAKLISLPIEKAYTTLWPTRETTQGPLRLGFLLVNVLLMSTVGLFIYAYCKTYDISETGSILAMIAVLIGGRWGNLFAAIPITDSLYLLTLCGTLYALKKENNLLLFTCIIIGPLAKESFIFMLPLIFFTAKFSKLKIFACFSISLVVAFGIRYQIDHITNISIDRSMHADLNHINNLYHTVLRIVSIRGLGELGTVLGLFSMVLIVGLMGGKKAVNAWTPHVDQTLWWFTAIIILHALLSTEVARMLYLGSACWAVLLGLIWDKHPWFSKLKTSMGLN
jgi:hypothetical protein